MLLHFFLLLRTTLSGNNGDLATRAEDCDLKTYRTTTFLGEDCFGWVLWRLRTGSPIGTLVVEAPIQGDDDVG